MREFNFTRVRCLPCGDEQSSADWGNPCAGCGWSLFRVEIERVSQGLDVEELALLLAGTALMSPVDAAPYYRLESLVHCEEITGAEIRAFKAAGPSGRRDYYVLWKRREFENSLDGERRLCGRCISAFKPYDNEWNRLGFCSRVCRETAAKADR